MGDRFVAAAAAIGLVAGAASAMAGPLLVPDPGEVGPNEPAVGQSAFDELYRDVGGSYDLPRPFAALLHDLEARVADGEVTVVLVPLGRSLQRHAAWPDYFAAPRIVVAVTSDPAPAARPLLEDRLYIGYSEPAGVLEVVSWNEAAGRFEFQVVEDYRPGGRPVVEPGERSVCAGCHQGQTPIFATALWGETNGDPAVAARLAPLGERYHAVPVRGSVDLSDAFDRSTDRAARLPFTDWLWRTGCGGGAPGVACRAALLREALMFRLRGNRRGGAEAGSVAHDLVGRLQRLAPQGIAMADPDLANREPLREIEDGVDPYRAVEPDGAFEPTVRRRPVPLWDVGTPAAALVDIAVRGIATSFADGDVRWLDAQLADLGSDLDHDISELGCRITGHDGPGAASEVRFDCRSDGDGGGLGVSGFVTVDGDDVLGGRVRIGDAAARGQRLKVTGGRQAGGRLEIDLAEPRLGLAPRLGSGERIQEMSLREAEGALAVTTVRDGSALDAVLGRLAARAAEDAGAALGDRPLRRRAILAELAGELGA